MKLKFFLLFLCYLLLTVLAVFALLKRSHAPAAGAGMRSEIPRFRPEEIAEVKIEWRTNSVTLEKKDGNWKLAERGMKNASASKVARLLESLSTLGAVKKLDDCGRDILERLRLVTDDPQIIPGITVTLHDAAGREKFRIILGKGHFVKPEPGMPPAENAEGRYVRIDDSVYLIAKVFEDCHPVPSAWVEPLRLFSLNKALRITASEDGKPLWSVIRGSTAHPFTAALPAGGKVDAGILSKLADLLSKPFGLDLSLEDPAKLAFARTVRFSCADGFDYLLRVARQNKREYAIVQVSFAPDKVAALPGENASRLLKRKAMLQSRLNFERRYFHDNLFLVSDQAKLYEQIGRSPVKSGAAAAGAEKTKQSHSRLSTQNTGSGKGKSL